MEPTKLRILFFGTPEFAADSLIALHRANFQIVGVVTAPDKASGRGMKIQKSAVKLAAEDLELPIYQPNNLKSLEFLQTLEELQPDLGVVIAFRMLPQAVWSAPKLGTINLHGSLLPKYRGAAPIQHAIINGDKKTGLTIFFLKHEIDTGDILSTVEIDIDPTDDFGTLHDRMKLAGSKLIVEAVTAITTNNYKTISQSEFGEESFAPKINKEFCQLDLSLPLDNIHNKIRGLSPYPGAWVETEFGLIKIFKSAMSDQPSLSTDRMQAIGKKLFLKCDTGMLEVLSLQTPGKPKISGVDFVNGLKNR